MRRRIFGITTATALMVAFVSLAVASNARAAIVVNAFTSAGDSDLDFDGDFAYARSVGNVSGNLPVTIGDAQFSDGNSFWTGANNSQIVGVLGNTAADDNLEFAVQGLIFSNGNMVAEIPVTAGLQYKLQLLFLYSSGERGTELDIEGVSQGIFATTASQFEGKVATFSFVAGDSLLNLIIKPTSDVGNLAQPILNAFTLEVVPEPASLTLCGLGVVGLMWAARRRRGIR